MQLKQFINFYLFLILTFLIGCSQSPNNHKNSYYKKMEKLKYINHVNDFKWKNRLLVIRNKNQKFLFEQIKKNKNKLIDRDIAVVVIKDNNAFIKNNLLSEKFFKSLNKKMKHLDSSYETILFGLDGKIKKIYEKNIDLNEIFFDIDKMPMRMNEIKRNNY